MTENDFKMTSVCELFAGVPLSVLRAPRGGDLSCASPVPTELNLTPSRPDGLVDNGADWEGRYPGCHPCRGQKVLGWNKNRRMKSAVN